MVCIQTITFVTSIRVIWCFCEAPSVLPSCLELFPPIVLHCSQTLSLNLFPSPPLISSDLTLYLLCHLPSHLFLSSSFVHLSARSVFGQICVFFQNVLYILLPDFCALYPRKELPWCGPTQAHMVSFA